MSVVAEHKVLLSQLDWESHAFPNDESREIRVAACGQQIIAWALEETVEVVPGCDACAIAMGTRLDQEMTQQAERTRECIVDAVAVAAARDVATLIETAGRLDGPAQSKAIRALGLRSRTVRAWARWNVIAAFLLPTGMTLLGLGILAVGTGTTSGWTIPALVAGTCALVITGVGLWRANQRALQVAIGLQLRAQLHGDAEEQS